MDMGAALEQFNQDNLKRALADLDLSDAADQLKAALIRKQLDDAERAKKETR